MEINNRGMESLQRCLVLSIDVGSSSIRCTAYDVTSAAECDPLPVRAASSAPRKVIQPGTGRILVYSEDHTLFDDIDQCVDEVVQQLNSCMDKVVAIGFSTLVMNLIGVDEHGIPIGNDATMSYACQTPAVSQEVDRLKRYENCAERNVMKWCMSYSSFWCQMKIQYAEFGSLAGIVPAYRCPYTFRIRPPPTLCVVSEL